MANGQGAPGVRIQLVDNSAGQEVITTPNTVAGVVGFSSRGAFNRILRLTTPTNMDVVLGSGFNRPVFNQGLYAARGVLRNGGFVEFVRPYGEVVNTDEDNERELKSDAFVVSYEYNINSNATLADSSKNSLVIRHFASTRYMTDGYSSFGSREIFTISQTLTENTNVDFSLDQAADLNDGTGLKRVALFSIINEDPTASDRATDEDETSADSVSVTTASYKTAHTVTDVLTFDGVSTPTSGETFDAILHDGSTVTFEFVPVATLNTFDIEIGGTPAETMANLETAVRTTLTNHTVTRSGNELTVVAYFGINDDYDSLTQNVVFTEALSYLTTRPSVEDSYVVLSSGFGRNFLNLGLAKEVYVKDLYTNTSYTRHFLLTETGKDVAEVYLSVDYRFAGKTFTFAGTIVPFVFQDVNLFIGNAADAVAVGFKFLVNENEDLAGSVTDSTFDLAQSRSSFVVRAATTANIALSGALTVDTVVLTDGDRVLVKDQTNGANNGIWVVNTSGAWTRAKDANNLPEANEVVNGMYVYVTEGSANIDTAWVLDTSDPIYLGTTPLVFLVTTDFPPITSTFTKLAFDALDPAVVNDVIWSYDPRNNRSSAILGGAWELFLDKDKSDLDMLVAAGTDISNLGVRNTEELDFNVIEAMLNVCELRKDCFAIFDGVDEINIDTALRKMVGVGGEGETGRWGSIFDGRSIFFDSTYTKLNVEAVKSIELAGMITNNRRGGLYWIPPAGKDFGTVPTSFATRQKFVRKYNYAEDPNSDIARLYDANINPTRTTDAGIIIYGQKTMLKRSSALNRLNVTMLVAGIHKKFVKFLDTKVFQLNTAALRSNITNTLNAELEKIKNSNPAGLFDGLVICDDSNNPPVIIDQNRLIVDVRLQPTRATEFITLRTTVQRTGDDLTVSSVEIITGSV